MSRGRITSEVVATARAGRGHKRNDHKASHQTKPPLHLRYGTSLCHQNVTNVMRLAPAMSRHLSYDDGHGAQEKPLCERKASFKKRATEAFWASCSSPLLRRSNSEAGYSSAEEDERLDEDGEWNEMEESDDDDDSMDKKCLNEGGWSEMMEVCEGSILMDSQDVDVSDRQGTLLFKLPTELLFLVMERLAPSDVLRLALTSRWLHQHCMDNHLWWMLFARRWPLTCYRIGALKRYLDDKPLPMIGTGPSASIDWRRTYQEMEWSANRPVVLKNRLLDFQSLYADSLDGADAMISERFLARFHQEEHLKLSNSPQESLDVSYTMSSLQSTYQQLERKATITLSNRLQCLWKRTFSGIGGGVRAPQKVLTSKAAVVSINSTLIGLDKFTGEELWRKHLFCTHLTGRDNIVFVIGCDDTVYEGRIIIRERPLIAIEAYSGRELWRADLLPLGNDMNSEPSQPCLISSDHLLVSVDGLSSSHASLIINAHTGAVRALVKGHITACVYTKQDQIVVINDGHGCCLSTDGQPIWQLSRAFAYAGRGKGGIVELSDGSVILYHYAPGSNHSLMEAVLVDRNGYERWWVECQVAADAHDFKPRPLCPTIGHVEVRGDAGVLLLFDTPHGSCAQLISWDGETVFRHVIP